MSSDSPDFPALEPGTHNPAGLPAPALSRPLPLNAS